MTKFTPYKLAAYEQALAFRRRGFTYSEIAKICNVSISTLSLWLANEPFSRSVAAANAKKAIIQNKKRLSLINKARNTERKHQYAEVVRLAETEYKHYRTSPLFIAGLMLYMSAGDNQHPRLIRMADSRSELHQILIRFVMTYLGVEKTAIRFWLLLYPDLEAVVCMKHWSKKTGLSVSQFHKNQVIPRRNTKHPLQFGVGNTIIGSTLLKKKLMRWIELAKEEFSVKAS